MLSDALYHMSSTRSDKAPYSAASYEAELSSISRGDVSQTCSVKRNKWTRSLEQCELTDLELHLANQ